MSLNKKIKNQFTQEAEAKPEIDLAALAILIPGVSVMENRYQ